MGKRIADIRIDEQLAVCEGDEIHFCAGEPTTKLQATTTNNLASAAIDSGDYTKANGDTSGRKNTLAVPADTPITGDGVCDHVAVTRAADLDTDPPRFVTTLTAAQDFTSGGTIASAGNMVHEIGDLT